MVQSCIDRTERVYTESHDRGGAEPFNLLKTGHNFQSRVFTVCLKRTQEVLCLFYHKVFFLLIACLFLQFSFESPLSIVNTSAFIESISVRILYHLLDETHLMS